MPVYTIHEPPRKEDDSDTLAHSARFVFVRDGFHFWAFLLAPLWMLRHRMWLELIAYLALPLIQRDAAQWISAWIALTVSVAVITWVHFRTLRWRVLVPAAAATVVALWPFIQRAVARGRRPGPRGRDGGPRVHVRQRPRR